MDPEISYGAELVSVGFRVIHAHFLIKPFVQVSPSRLTIECINVVRVNGTHGRIIAIIVDEIMLELKAQHFAPKRCGAPKVPGR